MSDLIKREDAIKALKDNREFIDGDAYPFDCACDVIQAVPSADRPQGKWILSDLQSKADNDNGNYAYVCTNCNHTDVHAKTQKVPYCWWCGARMKGADDE